MAPDLVFVVLTPHVAHGYKGVGGPGGLGPGLVSMSPESIKRRGRKVGEFLLPLCEKTTLRWVVHVLGRWAISPSSTLAATVLDSGKFSVSNLVKGNCSAFAAPRGDLLVWHGGDTFFSPRGALGAT